MINLLPQEHIETLKRQYKKRLALVALYCSLMTFAFGVLALLPAYISAESRLGEYTTELAAMAKINIVGETSSVSDIVKDTNFKLSKYDEVRKAPKTASVLNEFFGVVPAGISLDQLQFDASTMKVSLLGSAKTREALLTFQKNLQDLPNVSNVNIPVSSFVKQKDVSFNITVVITKTL